MSKKIAVDLKGFKGSVTLAEPLNLQQVFEIENAKDAATSVEPSSYWSMVNTALKNLNDDGTVKEMQWSSRSDKFFLVAILACAEKFEINGLPENLTVDTFPMTPRKTAHALVELLWLELNKIYDGEIEIPNE
jgi:hypothetical protein